MITLHFCERCTMLRLELLYPQIRCLLHFFRGTRSSFLLRCNVLARLLLERSLVVVALELLRERREELLGAGHRLQQRAARHVDAKLAQKLGRYGAWVSGCGVNMIPITRTTL